MPRRKQISEILELMKNTHSIRNIGLVGHIDHGKTTLSDSLLSEAGLLSPDLAGEARVLDYLEEEQRRGITMKSTNISLYYEKPTEENKPYLINLVDTPGHLDFSGKVTRALRLIDGVVVVVDAVEEIITQSETVIKQALQEGVKPVLYINKVDRLIRELKLTDDEIKKKYIRIINDFNSLIRRHADRQFKKGWQVSPAAGTVAFGSALHKWGFTSNILEHSTLKFKDVRERYQKELYQNKLYEDLPVYLPIHKAILEMVVNHLPNPEIAQKYRINKIWGGDADSEVGKAMTATDPEGPLVVCLSKVQADKHGLVATGRVFSGSCSKRKKVLLLRENREETIQRVALFMGQRREQVEEIPVGNIVAIEGLKTIRSGETLVLSDSLSQMVPFENVKYISTPVITVSVEPEYLRDLDELKGLIENLLIEDPNLHFEINAENGEFLLSGMGPLHLEVAADDLEKRGIKVNLSNPRAVFKESCRHSSNYFQINSSNGVNSIEINISRLDEKTTSLIHATDVRVLDSIEKPKTLFQQKSGLTENEVRHLIFLNEEAILVMYYGDKELDDNLKSAIFETIEKVRFNGFVAGEKLTELKIEIKSVILKDDQEEVIYNEVSSMIYNAIKFGLERAEAILLEPIYHTVITLPPEQIKNATTILSKYSAKVKNINQDKDYQATIDILLPVRYSMAFAEEIRSITSGRAFWQNEFYAFKEIPITEAKRLIEDLRFSKGLIW